MKRGGGRPFQKGQSGNPGGRPKMPLELSERARNYSIEMLEVPRALALDEKQAGSVRVSAATAIIDRGYGKPAVTLNASVQRRVIQMSDEELLAIIHAGTEVDDEPERLN